VPLRSNTTAKQHRGSMELNYCAIELRSLSPSALTANLPLSELVLCGPSFNENSPG
jgi:hypothetical protein